MKLKDAKYKSHWNILVSCDQKKNSVRWNMSHGKMSDFISFSLYVTLVIKLRNFDFKIHWSTSTSFYKTIYDARFEYAPWENLWFCLIFLVWV